MVSFPEMFPAATVSLLLFIYKPMFREPFYTLPAFLFLEGVFAPYSPVLTQPSSEQHCQLGWAAKETPSICWA